MGPPLSHEEMSALEVEAGGRHFRGGYRDFSLWITEDELVDSGACEGFGEAHRHGNDGLWVIEYDEEELMLKERARMLEIGVEVKAQHKKTLIVSGGEEAADKLGYDACGSEEDKSFISVSPRDVRGPRPMAAATKAQYKQRLQQKEAINLDLLSFISEEQLEDTISRLQEYVSRNSFSQDNGLNQAAAFAEEQLLAYGFEVTRMPFREDMTAQIIATKRGTDAPDEIVVVGAHFDSRGTMNSSPTMRRISS